jgi:ferric-dicitrate binding protein FerR (iron transport regulator)
MEPQRLPDGLLENVLLIERYLSKEITGDEQETLDIWLRETPENKAFFESVTDKAELQELLRQFYAAKAMTSTAKASAQELIFGNATPIRSLRSRWKQWTAAAAILMLVATGAYVWFNQKEPKQVAVTTDTQKPGSNDVAPGKYKARLTLADGSTVILDSAATGKLAEQGNMKVVNKDGGLVYEQSTHKIKEALYNTLTTSKGEIYSLLLADGSRVWLNSASSIRYPVAFTGQERKVEITGEAYFEIAHLHNNMPFKVIVHGMEVKVLGTHFNINAYADETKIRTTLLEGSVAVTPAGSAKAVILKVGQQAGVTGQTVDVIRDADTEQAVAWKNGYFQFNEADLKTVMREIERWYDVQVVYEGKIPEKHFGGKIPRDANASQVLETLEDSKVHFRIEGKKIIVMP